MTLLQEIASDSNMMQIKILRTYMDSYPVIDWTVWKQQVIDEREYLNPFKRFGMIWFHVSSVVKFFHVLDYQQYSWLNQHHPFFRSSMAKKVFVIRNLQSRMVRGIKPEALGLRPND